MSLSSLPTEVHLAILPHLSDPSILDLKLTNRHFFPLITEDHIRTALRNFEDANIRCLLRSGYLTCFFCFRFARADLFWDAEQGWCTAVLSRHERGFRPTVWRRCDGCEVPKERRMLTAS
jgi:hypothetical protein